MSQNALSRELALRIGLAARALPDTDAKRLLTVLAHCVDAPLTEAKVAALDLLTLKTACRGEFSHLGDDVLQQALSILKNTAAEKILPAIVAYQEGDLPNSVRIACASDDAIHVNGHFGACTWFMVYQVNRDEARLVDIRTADIPQGLVVDDKNVFRAEQIQDCKVVYVTSVGGPAAAKIVKLGIHPMKLAEVVSLAEVIAELQQVMSATPPPWLAKAMGIAASERFKFEREAAGS
ncbi:NifB/NifX family molybdenum-iron cluster-binding protein [Methylovulum psychrotolerans]|uniref:Dinitrogenase iron-molybdenum cofactor biosynthesis protein n=1 Tax=Methylovulum psychrotolerans TaxID=1704499 RepID=A0A2S5CG15_9GAMM|nr:NifB/NifX family molybdenum-iron cluster-binding protein [Methylovulum psychrotolerans]POZ49748.1 dinitrogenase iron-molybdenum cofactor biosynthesis protein [Methylovulum psychrotolerans]